MKTMEEKQFDAFANVVLEMTAEFGRCIARSMISSIEMITDEQSLVESSIADYVSAVKKVVDDYNASNGDYHITYYPVLIINTPEHEKYKDFCEDIASGIYKTISGLVNDSIEDIKDAVADLLDSGNRNAELMIGFIHNRYVSALVGSVDVMINHFNETYYSDRDDSLLYEFTFKTELKGVVV